MSYPFRADLDPTTFGQLVEHVRSIAERLPDSRTGENIVYSMADAAIGAVTSRFRREGLSRAIQGETGEEVPGWTRMRGSLVQPESGVIRRGCRRGRSVSCAAMSGARISRLLELTGSRFSHDVVFVSPLHPLILWIGVVPRTTSGTSFTIFILSFAHPLRFEPTTTRGFCSHSEWDARPK